jgi:hypothetical protein
MKSGPLITASFLTIAVATAFAGDREIICLDLRSHGNQKLNSNFHNDRAGNNLAALPVGKQVLDGIIFEIGESLIHLNCTQLKDMPDKVEGIRVDRSFERLHILHAAAFNTEDNTVIGLYVIQYADGTRENSEIVYGQDLSDWWFGEEDKEPARAKVAWKGDNEAAKANSKKIQLYHTVWINPFPEKKVVSIDFLAAEKSNSAPFCLAMTVE